MKTPRPHIAPLLPPIPRPLALLLLCLAAALLPCGTHAQPVPSPRFTDVAVVDHHVGRLSWDSVPQALHYQVQRRYPGQEAFAPLATLLATHYFDTLRRVICADTVSYRVLAQLPDTLLTSDTAGLFFQDNIPTAACRLRLCTVDTLLRRLRLSWYPSPDTDVMGYCICMGSPCLSLDTVWGRLNTSYLCPATLAVDSGQHHDFRVFAFDSCLQASPLTPYFHNPALRLSAPHCSRQLSCSWNNYVNMPDSVARYVLHYRVGPDTLWRTHTVGPQGPFRFDTLFADLSISRITAYLSVHNRSDSLAALSSVVAFAFPQPDTPQFVRILAAHYVDSLSAVDLSFQVDPAFLVDSCSLLRATAMPSPSSPSSLQWLPFQHIATLHPSSFPDPQQLFHHTDHDISRSAEAYSYRLSVPDRCAQRHLLSDTAVVFLPPSVEPAVWIPNIFRPGDPSVGLFCLSSPTLLAQDFRLEIYTRWGQRVFITHSLGHCWDGTDSHHRPLPQGVYAYRATCRHTDGTLKTYAGTVTLLR